MPNGRSAGRSNRYLQQGKFTAVAREELRNLAERRLTTKEIIAELPRSVRQRIRSGGPLWRSIVAHVANASRR